MNKIIGDIEKEQTLECTINYPGAGDSAYQVAVNNGFKGTQEEWLTSLKGDPGPKGKDGVSITHSWNGTILTVTSANGTSSSDLKGDKGDRGDVSKEQLEEVEQKICSQFGIETVEGENITLNNSSNLPYKKFNIKGKSIQEGTPTPETPAEIQCVDTVKIKQTNKDNTLSNDYEILLSQPLRSLPNGASDTIEKDGIHRRVRELRLLIADMNNDEDYPGWKNVNEILEDYPLMNGWLSTVCKYQSNITPPNNNVSINTTVGNGVIFLDKSRFGLTQTQWKEQYPDLVFQLQYQLPEEVIEPFNEDQQTIIDDIYNNGTFKGATNLNTTSLIAPGFDIEYYKDLEDTLNNLQKVLKDILEAIQKGGTTSNTIAEIEQIIVSYFENKTVEEVEG